MFSTLHKNVSHVSSSSHEFSEDDEVAMNNVRVVQRELNLAPTTVMLWFNFCREVLVDYCLEQSQRLGGPGHIVELYEGKFRRKYPRTEGKWLIGGVQRDAKKVFLVAADDCKEDTLVQTIKQYVLPKTTIITDSWSSFKTLGNHGYTQKKLNNTDNYVDPETGQYTSDMKKMWKNVKGQDRGLRRARYSETYLAQLLFKKMYAKQCDRFHNFLLLAARFCSPQISKNLEKYEEWTRMLNVEEFIMANTSMEPSALKEAYNSIGNGAESLSVTASPRAKCPRNTKIASKKQSANTTSLRQRKTATSMAGRKRRSETPLDEHLLNTTTFRPRYTATTEAEDEIKSEVPEDEDVLDTTTFRPRETLMAKRKRSEPPLDEYLPNATCFELKEAKDIKQEEPEIKEEVEEYREKNLAGIEEMVNYKIKEEKVEYEIKEEKVEDEIKDEKFEVTIEEVKEEPIEEYEVPYTHEPVQETCVLKKDESEAPEEPVGIEEMDRMTATKITCHESYQNMAENIGVNQIVLPHNIQKKQHSITLRKRPSLSRRTKKKQHAFILGTRSSQPLSKDRSTFTNEQVELKKCLDTRVIDSGLACRVEKQQYVGYSLPEPAFQLHSIALPVFTPEQENQLEECFKKADEWFKGLKSRDARRLVYNFAVRYNIKRYPSWDIYGVADRKWFMEFLKRHPSISVRNSRSRRNLNTDIDRILNTVPKLISVTVTTQENSENCNVSNSHKADSHKSSGSQEFKSDSCNSVLSTDDIDCVQKISPKIISITTTTHNNSENSGVSHSQKENSHKLYGSQKLKSDIYNSFLRADSKYHLQNTVPRHINVTITTKDNSKKCSIIHPPNGDSHKTSGSQELKSDSRSSVLSTGGIKHIQKILPNLISVRTTTQENSEKFNESHLHKKDSHRLSGSQDLKGDSRSSALSADNANNFQNTAPKLISVTITTKDNAKKCRVNHSHKEGSYRLSGSQEFRSDTCTDNINCLQNKVPKPISVTITTKDNSKTCSVSHLHEEYPHKFSGSQGLKNDSWYFSRNKVYQITNYKKNVSVTKHPSDTQENKMQNKNVLNIPACLKEGSNDNQFGVNGKTIVMNNKTTLMMKAGNVAGDNISQIITTKSDACHVRHEWLFNETPEVEKESGILLNMPVSGMDRESFNDTQSDICAGETVFVDVEELKEEEDNKEEDMLVRNSDPICL